MQYRNPGVGRRYFKQAAPSTRCPGRRFLLVATTSVITAVLLAVFAAGRAGPPIHRQAHTIPAPTSQEDGSLPAMSELPVDFIENRGQWDPAIKFIAQRGSMTARLDNDSIELRRKDATINLTFVGASPGATLSGEEKRGGYYNFVFGTDPAGWQAAVPAYGSVSYRGIYDGVDVRLREAAEQLAYDLLLAPRADLGQVVVHTEGASGLEIAGDGSLLVQTAAGPLRQSPPLAWETLPDGELRPIESRFRIIDAERYGFEAPAHNPAFALVVDPGLDWATFLGGAGDDTFAGLALASDGTGDIIIAGQSQSPDFPRTGGNLQAFDYGDFGAAAWRPYVARLNATGTALVYATLFGGSGNHSVRDVAVDPLGRPVIVGDTNSLDFPTTPGAADTTPGNGNGDYDGYVIKFNAAGSGVVFGTYLAGTPGTAGEVVWFADHDPSGSVIVSGVAGGPGFPVTAGSYPGQPGLFVSRLSPTGALTYSGFVGPASVYAMAVDQQGFVIITGQTSATTFPTTLDAFDPTSNGNADAFVARLKLDGAGSADLKYSTYLGGAQWIESANGVAVDPTNPELVTVVGFTRSGDFPTTAGAYQRIHPVPVDGSVAFITRFRFPTAAPNSLVWSTMFGAPGNQAADTVVIDSTGAAIIAGSTAVNNPPTTERSYDRVPGKAVGYGPYDAFAARISADGSQVLYSTLLGGSAGDAILDAAYTGGTSVVVGGVTNSPDFPVSATAFDPVYAHDGKQSGGATPGTYAFDAFVARFTLEANATTDLTPPPAPELRWPPQGATYTAHVLAVPFDWTDVADASGIEAYHLQISPNPTFTNDLDSELRGWFEPWLPASVAVKGFSISETGTRYFRVQALDRAGNLGPWSAVRSITIQDPAPPPAPTLLSPPNNGQFAPGSVTFAWNAAPNAQYYTIQIDDQPDFRNPVLITAYSLPQTQYTASLTAEKRYWWRVYASNQTAQSPWSTVWSFEIKQGSPPAPAPPPAPTPTPAPSTGPGVASITPAEQWVGTSGAQLTVNLAAPAPAGGAVVSLAAVYPDRVIVPATVTVPAGSTSAPFTVTARPSQVQRSSGIVAEYGGVMVASWVYTIGDDPVLELNSISPTATTVTGGATVQVTVSLLTGWTAGPGGALVALGSTNPALASVPPSVTIPPGANSATFNVTTQPVSAVTNVFILASRSFTLAAKLTIGPPGTLASLGLNPTTVTGGNPSQGTVTLSSAAPAGGVTVALSSHDTTVATVPPSVSVPAGASSATFTVSTNVVCCQGHWSQITASAGGITKFATINVNPAPPGPTLSSLSLSPASVTGGGTATGTVTLSATVSACCAVVALSSSNPAVASVPPSVTVPIGSTSAQFTVTTTSVTASTTVTITGERATLRSAVLTVNPPGAPTPTPTPAPVVTPTPTPAPDTVGIQRAEYDTAKQELLVEATSTRSTATLTVRVTASGALIGTMINDGGGRYRGQFSWPTNPQNITVNSSLGGSATRAVTVK